MMSKYINNKISKRYLKVLSASYFVFLFGFAVPAFGQTITVSNLQTNTSASVNVSTGVSTVISNGTGAYFINGQIVNGSNVNISSVISDEQRLMAMCVECVKINSNPGEKSANVVKLQNFLNKYYSARLNSQGFYGPVTTEVVRNFQATYGLPVTGIQDTITSATINSIICGKIAVKGQVNTYPKTVKVVKVKNVKYYNNSKVVVNKNVKLTQNYVRPVTGVYNSLTTAKNNIVKNYGNVATSIKEPMIGIAPNANLTASSATKTSILSKIGTDWNKIKENYKAYLLVLLLVAALFWFLRKAATE